MEPCDSASESQAPETDLETQLIEDSYRSLSDAEAFDEMLANWAARLDSNTGEMAQELETPKLSKHLGIMTPLLEQFSDAISPDSFKSHIAEAKGPAVLATAEGSIVYSNPMAQAEWELWTGKRSDFGFLAEESLPEWEALRRSASGQGNRLHGILQMRDQSDGKNLCIVSVIQPTTGFGRLLRIERIASQWTSAMETLLSDTFGITASEVDVCRHLLNCSSLNEVAEKRGSSPETVKKQLRSIFSKSDTHNQTELIRLLASLTAQFSPPAPEIVISWKDPFDREENVTDAQGNQLTFSRMGAKEGRPAIMVHGPLTGNILPQRCDKFLADSGITLYTVSRPGFGNSSKVRESCSVASGSKAIGTVIDHLGVDSCSLMGLVGGFIPAVHYAAHNPGRVDQLISLGGCFPFNNRADRRYLPYHHRVFLDIVKYAPKVSEFLVRHAHRGAKYGGAEFILRRVYRDSEQDLQVLLSPEILPYSFAAVALLMANGYQAFLKDQALLTYPWAPLLKGLDIPIVSITGDADPVFPLDKLTDVADGFTNWRIIPVKDGGQTIYFSHQHEVCKHLSNLI